MSKVTSPRPTFKGQNHPRTTLLWPRTKALVLIRCAAGSQWSFFSSSVRFLFSSSRLYYPIPGTFGFPLLGNTSSRQSSATHPIRCLSFSCQPPSLLFSLFLWMPRRRGNDTCLDVKEFYEFCHTSEQLDSSSAILLDFQLPSDP